MISECNGSGSGAYSKLKQTNVQESCYSALPTHDISPARRRTTPNTSSRFSGWSSLKKILASKKLLAYQQHHQPTYTKCQIDREDSKSNLLASRNQQQPAPAAPPAVPKIVETNVSISAQGKYVNGVVTAADERPASMPLVSLRAKRNHQETSLALPAATSRKTGTESTTARFSLYDDRMMSQVLREEEDRARRSSSVPFGIDSAEEPGQAKVDAKDATCF